MNKILKTLNKEKYQIEFYLKKENEEYEN